MIMHNLPSPYLERVGDAPHLDQRLLVRVPEILTIDFIDLIDD